LISGVKLAGMIDHSVLRPESTEDDVKKACGLAINLGLAAVVVNPAHIPIVAANLKDSAVKTCSVISFPFGLSTKESKLAEARSVIAQGAEEIGFVMNFSALRSGREDCVFDEIKSITELARSGAKKIVVKAILETCYLNELQKRQGCLLAVKGGADFVKTSTGFGAAGATVADVRLLKEIVDGRAGVKAAGGIRTLEQALQMVEAGADRIGTSSSLSILKGIQS
jgi:deoxyribose-phosphate aldolase